VNSLPRINKSGTVSQPWVPVYFLVEINHSVSKLCKLTETPHLKVFAKVSEPVTFASDCLLIRVLMDNIVFTAIHNKVHEDVPLLDISVWVDEAFAHIEVRKEVSKNSKEGRHSSVYEQFFRSFVYERKYNFGVAPVAKALKALKGKMEYQLSDSELLLTLHMPNRADFDPANLPKTSYYPFRSITKSTL
jgi:hypothetical protein